MGLFAQKAERDAHLVDAVAQPGGGVASSSSGAAGDAAAAAAAAAAAGPSDAGAGMGGGDATGSGGGAPQHAHALPHHRHPAHAGAPGDGGVPRGFLRLLHQGQARLVDMLNGLPPEHGAAQAASKTLRHIVHDARKHTRRRLRQMSSMETRSASGSRGGGDAFWDCELLATGGTGNVAGSGPVSSGASGSPAPSGSPGPRVAACGGSGGPGHIGVGGPPASASCPTSGGLETLRLGVQLYLEELVLVLDAWCDALGIESAHEKPLSKRPKTLRAPAGRG